MSRRLGCGVPAIRSLTCSNTVLRWSRFSTVTSETPTPSMCRFKDSPRSPGRTCTSVGRCGLPLPGLLIGGPEPGDGTRRGSPPSQEAAEVVQGLVLIAGAIHAGTFGGWILPVQQVVRDMPVGFLGDLQQSPGLGRVTV